MPRRRPRRNGMSKYVVFVTEDEEADHQRTYDDARFVAA
jgi:hypothetical protein